MRNLNKIVKLKLFWMPLLQFQNFFFKFDQQNELVQHIRTKLGNFC